MHNVLSAHYCGQMRNVWSLPLLTSWPPGSRAKAFTRFVWPVRFCSGSCVCGTQIRIVLSSEALAAGHHEKIPYSTCMPVVD